MKTPQTREEWRDLLQHRIEQSGLSATKFARQVLTRGPRTLRNWLDLTSPIPHEVKQFLVDPRPRPWPAHNEWVRDVEGQ